MKNSIAVLFIIILFQSCNNESKKNAAIVSTPIPKYETYNYSGFTKEEIYGFHKRIFEGGNWTELE